MIKKAFLTSFLLLVLQGGWIFSQDLDFSLDLEDASVGTLSVSTGTTHISIGITRVSDFEPGLPLTKAPKKLETTEKKAPNEPSLSELTQLFPSLSKPFPIAETPIETLEYRLEDWCVADFSIKQLRHLLPELNKPFPYEYQRDEFFPDCSFAFDEDSIGDGWLGFTALEQAYEEVTELSFNPEVQDWQILVKDKAYFWADGRVLPESVYENKEMYSLFFRYLYTQRIFEVSTQRDLEYYQTYFSNNDNNTQPQKDEIIDNRFFLCEIYGEISEEAIRKSLEEITILGAKVYAHKRVAEKLTNINKKLTQLKQQGKLKSFFSNYSTSYGFNWRPIEYSGRLSNHALGIAVDIMAKNYGKLNAYWYWESVVNKKWFLLKRSDRWIPPDEVIKLFENEGFIWGGYWTLWDTMHFEFRPELIYISEYLFTQDNQFFTEADIENLDKAKPTK